MSESPLRLIKKCLEYLPIDDVDSIPKGIRGIYVLYKYHPRTEAYDVVYVGMATNSMAYRLRKHRIHKAGLWDHCSLFEVWDNIRNEEIEELEGLFRHLYRFDTRANKLNKQKSYKKLRRVKVYYVEELAPLQIDGK